MPLRVMRYKFMRTFQVSYAEWRTTPWHIVRETFRVMASEAAADEERRRQTSGG